MGVILDRSSPLGLGHTTAKMLRQRQNHELFHGNWRNAGSLSVRRCCVWRGEIGCVAADGSDAWRKNSVFQVKLVYYSQDTSFKTVWVEQSFDIRLFKVCFVPSFCSRWVRGPTRPRLLCSEPGGRARRFLRRKWCRERTSCLSGSSANWSLLTCECCVVVKSPKKDNQYDEVRRNTAAMRTFLAWSMTLQLKMASNSERNNNDRARVDLQVQVPFVFL